MPEPVRVVVAVCTFRRNEPLRRLLTAIEHNAAGVCGRAEVGVVVVDDNPGREAAGVCDDFADRFTLGLHYRPLGKGNISEARNLALETALPLADLVAMTDDDCVPVDEWLSRYLDALRRWDCDCVTGPCFLVPAPDAQRWLTDQPFLEDAQLRFSDGEVMELAATNNSLFSTAFFRDRPWLRFEPELGVVGGEDMVFFRTAVREGLSVRFVADAIVHGHESPSRCTFGHQLRSRFWIGNTEWVTNRFLGEATRPWWVLRSLKLYAQAVIRPIQQFARSGRPQFRYALASAARATGMLAGALGVRVRHH